MNGEKNMSYSVFSPLAFKHCIVIKFKKYYLITEPERQMNSSKFSFLHVPFLQTYKQKL